MAKIAVLYHQDNDGFGAAYACWEALRGNHELLFIPVQYGQEPPYEKLYEFAPKQLVIVDFSYKRPVMEALIAEFIEVICIDHHLTAQAELEGLPGCIFDMSRAGCVLTWAHLLPHENVPAILWYVQDRDLWKFEMPKSKEVNAYISTLEWDFEVWAKFDLDAALTAGDAILKFQAGQIKGRLRDVRIENIDEPGTLNSYTVPFVNASENISELGDAMCHAYPDAPFSVSYCDRADGQRSYSLRSRFGFDVSEVAKAFGGGGHKAAAGFTLKAPDII